MSSVWDESKRESEALWHLAKELEAAAAALKAGLAAAPAEAAGVAGTIAALEAMAACVAAAAAGFAIGQGVCWIQSKISDWWNKPKPAPRAPTPSHSMRSSADGALKSYMQVACAGGPPVDDLMDWCVTSPLASAAYRGYRAAFSVAVHTAQMLAQGSATPAPSVFTEAVRLDLRMLSDARREMAAEITASGGSLANISISGAGWNQFAADVRVNGAPTIEVDLLAAVFEAAQIALPDSAGASLAQWIQEDPSYAETGFARAPAGAWQMADYLNMSAGWFEARMQEIPAAAAIDAATLDEGLRKLVLSAGAVIGADGQVPVTAGTPLGAVVSASRLSLPDFLIRNPVTVRLSDVRISLLSSGGGTAASARPAVSVLPAPKTIAAPAPLASAAAPKPIGAMPVRPSTLVMNPDASAPRPVASPAVAAGLTAARALAASGGSAGAVAIGTPFAALSNGNGGANGEVVDALAVLLQAIAKADSTTSAPGSNAPQALIQAVGGLGDPASANPPANGDYLPGQMSAGLPV